MRLIKYIVKQPPKGPHESGNLAKITVSASQKVAHKKAPAGLAEAFYSTTDTQDYTLLKPYSPGFSTTFTQLSFLWRKMS